MEKSTQPTNPLTAPFECYLFDSEKALFPISVHWHYFAEIILVKSGILNVLRGETTYRMKAGDILLISPLTQHALDKEGETENVVYEVIRLDMEQLGMLPSYTSDLRSIILEADQNRIPMLIPAAESRRLFIDQMIDMCVEEYANRAFGYDLKIRAILYLIVTSVIRIWFQNGFVPQGTASQIDPIYSLPSRIAHHIHEPLKVEDLADFCGLSYPWFARKFRQIYGISCKEYIEKVRTRKVEQYLVFTDCDLNYISARTGYADCSHLVRDFRKYHSETPIQFRRANRKKGLASFQFPQNY